MDCCIFQRDRVIEPRVGVTPAGAYVKLDFSEQIALGINTPVDEIAIHARSLEEIISMCQAIAVEARLLLDAQKIDRLLISDRRETTPEMLSMLQTVP